MNIPTDGGHILYRQNVVVLDIHAQVAFAFLQTALTWLLNVSFESMVRLEYFAELAVLSIVPIDEVIGSDWLLL